MAGARKPTMQRVAMVPVVVAITVITSCGNDEGAAPVVEPTTTSTRAAGTVTTTTTAAEVATTSPTLPRPANQVDMVDYDFAPTTIEVAVGATITWVNLDDVDHWVLSRGSDAIDSATLEPGNSYADTFTEAGTYDYFCNIHNTMTGRVVVR